MKKLFLKQSLIFVLIAFCGFAYSQEGTMLKYNYEKGKTYIFSTQFSNIVTQSMGGQDIKIESGINTISEMLVEDVASNGNITSLITLKNASVATKIPAMKRDTTMNFNDVNEQTRVVLLPSGKSISSVNLGDDNVLKMVGATKQFSKSVRLPNKSVIMGEKWSDKMVDSIKASQQNPVDMVITTDMEYTFVGVEVKDGIECLKIQSSGALSVNGKGNMQGMELFVEGTGKTEGFSYLNPKTLIVVNTEANTEMDMSFAVSGQQNMTMPMSQSMKSIIKIEEKK